MTTSSATRAAWNLGGSSGTESFEQRGAPAAAAAAAVITPSPGLVSRMQCGD